MLKGRKNLYSSFLAGVPRRITRPVGWWHISRRCQMFKLPTKQMKPKFHTTLWCRKIVSSKLQKIDPVKKENVFYSQFEEFVNFSRNFVLELKVSLDRGHRDCRIKLSPPHAELDLSHCKWWLRPSIKCRLESDSCNLELQWKDGILVLNRVV